MPVAMSPIESARIGNARRGTARLGERWSFASQGSKEWLGNSMVERKLWRFWPDSDSVDDASGSHKHPTRQQYSEAQLKKGGEHVD